MLAVIRSSRDVATAASSSKAASRTRQPSGASSTRFAASVPRMASFTSACVVLRCHHVSAPHGPTRQSPRSLTSASKPRSGAGPSERFAVPRLRATTALPAAVLGSSNGTVDEKHTFCVPSAGCRHVPSMTRSSSPRGEGIADLRPTKSRSATNGLLRGCCMRRVFLIAISFCIASLAAACSGGGSNTTVPSSASGSNLSTLTGSVSPIMPFKGQWPSSSARPVKCETQGQTFQSGAQWA